jgi:hypothetical protein
MAKKKDTPPDVKKKPRGPNRTSFSAERPEANPHAFPPGVSGNVQGTPRAFRALARALRAQGQGRATDAECRALDLPIGSSKVQVAAERILWTMRRGTPSEQLYAAEVFAKLTGEYTNRVALGFDPDMMEEESIGGPKLIVQFVESEHDRLRREGEERREGKLLDASPASPRDVTPDALVAQREAETVTPRGDQPLAPQPPPPPRSVFAALAAPQPAPRPKTSQEIRAEIYKKLYER